MGAKRAVGAAARWRALIAEQERSGERIAEFAGRRGLNAATLYWWRSRLRRGDRNGTEFVPVEIVGAARGADLGHDGCFELELTSGRRLRVPRHFDAAELTRLVAAVERAC